MEEKIKGLMLNKLRALKEHGTLGSNTSSSQMSLEWLGILQDKTLEGGIYGLINMLII